MKRIRGILFGVMLVLIINLYELSQRRIEMPPRTPMSTWMKIWLLAAVAVVVINMLGASCAYGQVSIVRAPLTNYGAITTCDQDGNIVVVVNQSVSSENYPEVISHESVHVAEIRQFPGGCRAFLIRYREDLDFRFGVEARAYCSNFNLLVAGGMPKEKIVNLVTYMQKTYAPEKTFEQARKLVPCGQDVTIPP